MFSGKVWKMEEYCMYFPFFKPQTGGKRSAIQPQTIYSEFPYFSAEYYSIFPPIVTDFFRKNGTNFESAPLPLFGQNEAPAGKSPRRCVACQKSPKNTVSFRTSPQTGVGIPRLNVKATGLGLKIFEYQGDCHASVSTGSQ